MYPLQYVYTVNNIVTAVATIYSDELAITPPADGSVQITLAEPNHAIQPGWIVSGTTDAPIFTAPSATSALPVLTPMTLYMAFTPAERIAIKASTDPMVMEFWAMYQLSVQLQKPTDPNLVSVQEALAYLAQPKDAMPPGAGILASQARVTQILAGIPQ